MTADKPAKKKPIPRTPARQFRLTDHDLNEIDAIAAYYRLTTRTEALRYAIGAARREMERRERK